jgi:hypothetical protein
VSGGLTQRLRRSIAPLGRKVDERLFPEGPTAADHWLRDVMDRRVDHFLRSLKPATLTAVEISGDAKAALGWKRFVSLNYPHFDICDPTPRTPSTS